MSLSRSAGSLGSRENTHSISDPISRMIKRESYRTEWSVDRNSGGSDLKNFELRSFVLYRDRRQDVVKEMEGK